MRVKDSNHWVVIELMKGNESITIKQSESEYRLLFKRKNLTAFTIGGNMTMNKLWEELAEKASFGTMV